MVWKPRGRGAPSSLMNRLFALSFGIASAGGGGAAWTRAEEWRSIAAAEAEAPQANKFACLPFTHASATPRPDTSKRGVKKKIVGAGVAVVWFKVQSASTSSAPTGCPSNNSLDAHPHSPILCLCLKGSLALAVACVGDSLSNLSGAEDFGSRPWILKPPAYIYPLGPS